jgi:hypothetical protein
MICVDIPQHSVKKIICVATRLTLGTMSLAKLMERYNLVPKLLIILLSVLYKIIYYEQGLGLLKFKM